MITIRRKSSFSNKYANFNIYLDGNKIGTIKDGGRVEFNIEPGKHTLQTTLNISASNSIDFEIDENKFKAFETGSNVNIKKNILTALMHPAILIGIFLIDRIINYNYFIVYALIAYIGYEIYTYIERKRKNKKMLEHEKYYIYLKPTDF